jgi:uncharacterized BrkB/YihY/UPF0761 family membrane protein
MIALLWCYLTSLAILIGAQLNATIGRASIDDGTVRAGLSPFQLCLGTPAQRDRAGGGEQDRQHDGRPL